MLLAFRPLWKDKAMVMRKVGITIDPWRGIACMRPVHCIMGKGDTNTGDFIMHKVPVRVRQPMKKCYHLSHHLYKKLGHLAQTLLKKKYRPGRQWSITFSFAVSSVINGQCLQTSYLTLLYCTCALHSKHLIPHRSIPVGCVTLYSTLSILQHLV